MAERQSVLSILDVLGAGGEAPAILAVQKDGVETWSASRLRDTALRFADGLSSRGLRRGEVVALFSDARPEAIAASLGTLAAGAVLLLVDVQLADPALIHVLTDSEARVVLTTADQRARLRRLALPREPMAVLLDATDETPDGWRQWLSDTPARVADVREEDPAALFYTSGTTGPPKGVPLSHQNLSAELHVLRKSGLIRPDDRLLLPLPLHHVYPFVVGLLAPLSLGAPVVLPYALTGPQVLRAIRETDTTEIVGVPRLYSAMVSGIEAKLAAGGFGGKLMLALWRGCTWMRRRTGWMLGRRLLAPLHRQLGPRLRILASGGSPLDPEVGRKMEGLGWPVAIGYGLTETSPLLTLKNPDAGPLESVGRPVAGVEMRIQPAQRDDESAPPSTGKSGETLGEVQARGPNIFAGYLHLPEETARAFTADGWFRTGDLGYYDNRGYLHITGRASTLIIMEGGENVQPDEVEQAYLAAPVVREIGVLQRKGKLVAVIVAETEQIRDPTRTEELIRGAIAELSKRLPSYQRLYDFVLSKQAIARTRLGKIQRHLLPKQYDAAKAGTEQSAAAGPISIEEMSDHDQGLLEHRAARVVWDVLAQRYPSKRLTPDTSPQLELGIDSLTWLDLTMEIGQRAGVELTEEALARVETVRDLLSETLEAAEGNAAGEGVDLSDPESLVSEEQKRPLSPLPWPWRVIRWFTYYFNRYLMKLLFRLRVTGVENIPVHGPVVLAPNHVSYLDPPAIGAAIPLALLRNVYWAAWTGIMMRNALFRAISRLTQVLPIDPQKGALSSLAFGACVLQRGGTLIWFPEGHRSENGQLMDFKPGLGMVLSAHPAMVVPVKIMGAYEAWPPGRRWPRFRQIEITFGSPMHSRALEKEGQGRTPQERIMQALRGRMNPS